MRTATRNADRGMRETATATAHSSATRMVAECGRRRRQRSGVSGKQLRELRKRAGIAANELAREMKTSNAHVCHVERGKRTLTRDLAARARIAALRIAERRLARTKAYVEQLEDAELKQAQLDMAALWDFDRQMVLVEVGG